MTFNELSKPEQQMFIDRLDENDMTWLEFLKVESGGFLAVAMERLYKLKQDEQPAENEVKK